MQFLSYPPNIITALFIDFLYFTPVPWLTTKDTKNVDYIPQGMSAREFVYTKLHLNESNEELAPPTIEVGTTEIPATLSHLRYFAKRQHLRHHSTTHKRIVWSSIEGVSVVLQGCFLHNEINCVIVNNQLFQLIPEENTIKLAARLKKSKLLDNIHVMEGGRGDTWIPLNGTTYAQPRRITWSVVISEDSNAFQDNGYSLIQLFSMYQSYRHISDSTVRPMPMSIFLLGVKMWHYCYPHLSAISRICPPSGCQMLIYYT